MGIGMIRANQENYDEINRLNSEARAHHMSYGQYVAFIQCQEQRKQKQTLKEYQEMYTEDDEIIENIQ